MPLEYTLEIDNNNISFVSKILYYIQEQSQSFQDVAPAVKQFILDDKHDVEGKPYFLIIPKDDVFFQFKEEPMCLSYKKNRSSKNFNMTEVRFDVLILSSNSGFLILREFLLMINEMSLKDGAKEELIRYLWKDEMWRYSRQFRQRKLETIYLEGLGKIVESLDKFIHDEKMQTLYTDLDIPYKKIFLFHGPPGTGKTSTIRALATRFKHHLSIVKSVVDMDDNTLESMISTLRKKTFLVLEDVDCLFSQQVDRQMTARTNISFSGFLNMLDGITQYEKLIVFVTTNYLEKLDTAFKRRIDMFVKFDYLNSNQIGVMYAKFFEGKSASKFISRVRNKNLTANALEKFFIDCIQSELVPEENINILSEYVSRTTGQGDTPNNMYA